MSIERLSGGLSNTSFKIKFESSNEPIVLRLYERDPAACCKELELLRSLSPTIPVPEVLYAETDAQQPFMFLRYIEGITFRELKATGDKRAVKEAAYSIGAVLATIGKQNTSQLLHVSDCGSGIGESIENHLTSSTLVQRLGDVTTRRVAQLVKYWRTRLQQINNERQLVHRDFRKQNVLVHFDGVHWTVAAILDWECAFLGSPLNDVGSFLRYENPDNPVAEPLFSDGFRDAGGNLPDDWFALSRVMDLESLCSTLASPCLPRDIEREIVELIMRTTMEHQSTGA